MWYPGKTWLRAFDAQLRKAYFVTIHQSSSLHRQGMFSTQEEQNKTIWYEKTE